MQLQKKFITLQILTLRFRDKISSTTIDQERARSRSRVVGDSVFINSECESVVPRSCIKASSREMCGLETRGPHSIRRTFLFDQPANRLDEQTNRPSVPYLHVT